jgi:hypothetical protein
MRVSYAAASLCVAAAVVAAVIGLRGHGRSPTASPGSTTPGSSHAATTSATTPPSAFDSQFPTTIRAGRMRPTYVRLPIPSADLDNLVRVHGDVIVALANKGAFFGEVYAAISTDDGGGWHIDSPQFARAGACGPCTTNHLNVTQDGTVFAWGNGSNRVKITTDLGSHWYQADFSNAVMSVTTTGRHLVVRALGRPDRAGRVPTRRYVSTDDGMTWIRGRALPTINN